MLYNDNKYNSNCSNINFLKENVIMIQMNKLLINIMTSLRILLGFLFLLCVHFEFGTIYLIIIFILAAISTLGDGWISRKYNLSSEDGTMFDVLCDFIFIMLSTWALVLNEMIPAWFLMIIILKLIEFFETPDETVFYEKFSQIVTLMFYVFPIVAILLNDRTIVLILAILITICVFISILSKIYRKYYQSQ